MLFMRPKVWCNSGVKKSISLALFLMLLLPAKVYAQPASTSGSVGVQGTVSAPPPQSAPSISLPGNGTSFSNSPITVSGFCTTDLLVRVFKNGVFSGSAQCVGGSFSLSIDLFSGQNDISARQYDLLDQESPESNIVSVSFRDSVDTSAANRVTLTSNFAKRGADPGTTLTWPIGITGGSAPYAVTVEWGDGETSLYSLNAPGEFVIDHAYKNPGSYALIIKAVDVNGGTAFLQLVAIVNGAPQPGTGTTSGSGGSGSSNGDGAATQPKTRILWQPAAIMIPFVISTFWLGKRFAIYRLRKKIEAGERPFSY